MRIKRPLDHKRYKGWLLMTHSNNEMKARILKRVPTVSESMRTRAHTAEMFSAPSGVMTGLWAVEPVAVAAKLIRDNILEKKFATAFYI